MEMESGRYDKIHTCYTSMRPDPARFHRRIMVDRIAVSTLAAAIHYYGALAPGSPLLALLVVKTAKAHTRGRMGVFIRRAAFWR